MPILTPSFNHERASQYRLEAKYDPLGCKWLSRTEPVVVATVLEAQLYKAYLYFKSAHQSKVLGVILNTPSRTSELCGTVARCPFEL